MNRRIKHQVPTSERFLRGDLQMRHRIVLPPEVASLGNEGFVYVTSLTKEKGVFGYIVSPLGLDMIISRIELGIRTLPWYRSAEQFDWMVIASHYGLSALAKVYVKDGKIAPPTSHLLSPPGPLWFSLRNGYALVGSNADDFKQHEQYAPTVQEAASAFFLSNKVSRSKSGVANRRVTAAR